MLPLRVGAGCPLTPQVMYPTRSQRHGGWHRVTLSCTTLVQMGRTEQKTHWMGWWEAREDTDGGAHPGESLLKPTRALRCCSCANIQRLMGSWHPPWVRAPRARHLWGLPATFGGSGAPEGSMPGAGAGKRAAREAACTLPTGIRPRAAPEQEWNLPEKQNKLNVQN